YDGRINLDTFDKWVYEATTYIELTKTKDSVAVKLAGKWLSGKASRFYMKYVAMSTKRWTMKDLFSGIFNYCFPDDFRTDLKESLLNAVQTGRSTVRDFARDLEVLAERFPEVTPQQIKEIFWKGVHQYIRKELISRGLAVERHKLKRMLRHASQIERA
ncbi:hypothetical protein PENSPDRAFT_548460, partial [Peniophora sp. CONT]